MVLFISDLDGTLLNNDSAIETRAVEKLNGLIGQGIHFTIATPMKPALSPPPTSNEKPTPPLA